MQFKIGKCHKFWQYHATCNENLECNRWVINKYATERENVQFCNCYKCLYIDKIME